MLLLVSGRMPDPRPVIFLCYGRDGQVSKHFKDKKQDGGTLLGRCAVWCGRSWPTFYGCLLSPLLGRFSVINRPDDAGSIHIWNVGQLLPDYKTQRSTREPYSYSSSRESEISLGRNVLHLCRSVFSLNSIFHCHWSESFLLILSLWRISKWIYAILTYLFFPYPLYQSLVFILSGWLVTICSNCFYSQWFCILYLPVSYDPHTKQLLFS
jgi:hypothetical protein